MSDASMPHCDRCNRVEYDCVCTVDYLDDIEDDVEIVVTNLTHPGVDDGPREDLEDWMMKEELAEEKREHDEMSEWYADHGGSD